MHDVIEVVKSRDYCRTMVVANELLPFSVSRSRYDTHN